MSSGVPTDLPPPTLPSSLTPAPVTVVRTPRPHPHLAEHPLGVGGSLSDQFSATTSHVVPPAQSTSLLLSGDELTSQQQQQLNISAQHHHHHQQQQQSTPATVYRMTNAEFSAAAQQAQVPPNASPPQYSGQPKVHPGGILTNAATPVVAPLTAPFQASMHPATAAAAANTTGLTSSSILASSFPPVTSNYAAVAHAAQQQYASSTITSIAHPFIPTATSTAPLSSSNAAMSLPVQGSPGGVYPSPLTAASQTVSGLPILPPSISFPSVAPKISLTPTTFQTAPTTTAS